MGGFFFDFEAVRTDLTEMLRAGTVKLSDFGESVRRPTSGGLDDDSEDESSGCVCSGAKGDGPVRSWCVLGAGLASGGRPRRVPWFGVG